MSHFFSKYRRIIYILLLFIILILYIVFTVPGKSKRDNSNNSVSDTQSETQSEAKTENSNNSQSEMSSENKNNKGSVPYDASKQGQGIGGGAITGNCSVGNRKLPIYCVDLSKKHKADDTKKYVAISFDAAWGDEDTIRILDILDKYNIKTTFFMTGGWVEKYPDKVLEIYNRGHDLGNHSQNHKEMSKLSVNEQREEIMSVANKIKEITGYDSFLFRPPYGDYNSTLIETVYGCNFYPIEWDVDSLDWKDYGVDNIIKTVTRHKDLKDGSIILMHNGSKFTADALESVINGLIEQGYDIVPVSQLIHTDNFSMNGMGVQLLEE